jgi:hypothetical protein
MFELALKFVVFVGAFIGGFLVVSKFVPHSKLEMNNEVAGFIYAVLGVIYGVLLAFVVVTVWEEYTDAERNASIEISHVVDVYRNANAFPDSVKREIKTETVHYMKDLIKYEWPAMFYSKVSNEAKASYLKIWETHLNYKPRSDYEKIWYSEAISELNQMASARRFRIDSIYYGIPSFMWIVLILGATLTIGFSYLFGAKNKKVQIIMIFCLSGTICLVLLLIGVLEHPFTGLIHVQSEHVVRALEQLK